MPVTATARQWVWTFSYANGKKSGKLVVPVGKAVRVELVSEDVLHGFYLPAFRVKRDVVPGMKNQVWFVADKAGSYDLFCSQYCGVGHSAMTATVEAIPEAKFQAWLREGEGGEYPGEEILEKHGCLDCHSLDGTAKVGPTLKGIWGREVRVLTNGAERTVTVDEAYLRRSILNPKADVVKGFPPIMPSFAGSLKPEEITTIIGTIRLAGTQGEKPDGAKLAKDKGCLACHSTNGSPGIAPTFKGLYQSRVKVRQDGAEREVLADDAYLRESIRKPGAKVVDGFQAIMPTFPELTDKELEALVEFIEGLK
jgi:cytochrome c oxidase subunit 2